MASEGIGGNGHRLRYRKIYWNVRKLFFPCVRLEQSLQRGYAVSILGAVQNPAGQSPEQPAVVHPV